MVLQEQTSGSISSSESSNGNYIHLNEETDSELAPNSEIDHWMRGEEATWIHFLEDEAHRSCQDPRGAEYKTSHAGEQVANPYQLQNECIQGVFGLLRNRLTQYVILSLSIFYFLVFGGACSVLFNQRSVQGQVFKFEVVHDHAENVALMSNIADIGLIHDACEIRGGIRHSLNNAVTIEFAEQVSVNGWFVKSNVSHAGFVPAVFQMLWSGGHGSPFQTLPSDRTFLAGFEGMFAHSSESWGVELRGQERTEMGLLPCLPCVIVSTMTWLALGAGCGLTSTAALLGRSVATVTAFRLSVGVLTVLSWVFIVTRLQDSHSGIAMPVAAWRGAITSTLLAPHAAFKMGPKQVFGITAILATLTHLVLVCVALAQDSARPNGLLLLLLRCHEVCVCVVFLVLIVVRAVHQTRAYQRVFESVQETRDRLDQVCVTAARACLQLNLKTTPQPEARRPTTHTHTHTPLGSEMFQIAHLPMLVLDKTLSGRA